MQDFFVRRQTVGKHLLSENLTGKCLREQLKDAIARLLPLGGVETCASLLRRCANAKALNEGRSIHVWISSHGYHDDTYLGNNLIQMYGKCGRLHDAVSAFRSIRRLNIYSYNNMISAFAQNGHLQTARRLFEFMPMWDFISCTAMLVANSQNGEVDEAKLLFDRMPVQDVVAWNAMIAAFAQTGRVREARRLFQSMDQEGVGADKVSLLSLLQAFSTTSSLQLARQLHRSVASDWDYVSDVVLGTAWVDMYGKCGSPEDAYSVFRALQVRNVVTWTAMLVAFANNGCMEQAEELFREMPEKNSVSWNAMITAYAQNNRLYEARELFEVSTLRDLSSWNIMITMHNQALDHLQSLHLFRKLVVEGFQVDKFSLVGALAACSNIPALPEGRLVHECVVEVGLEQDTVVANALINLYGKGGLLDDARAVFDGMNFRNCLISWNTMIASYSKNGHSEQALELFRLMLLYGVEPDAVTFVSVIFACSHGGFYDEGCVYFASVHHDFGILAFRDHYMCMIDLLARAGQLADAEKLMQQMPVEADDVALRTLLAACKTHGEFQRGKHVVQPDAAQSASDFALLSFCAAN